PALGKPSQMSALGQSRHMRCERACPLYPPIAIAKADFRYTPESGHLGTALKCPQGGKSDISRRAALGDAFSLIYCDRYFDGVVVVERISPHGSADFFLSGTFAIADLYASSTAFRFSCSSGVNGRRSGTRLIPGINCCWAKAPPINAAIIALAPPSNL